MTTLTFENNSIMAYVGADGDVTGYSGLTVLPDWGGDSVYMIQTSAISGPGVRKFDIDPDGDEALVRSKTQIGVDEVSAASGGGASISRDGSKIWFISDSGNVVQIAEVATAGLTLNSTFGTAGSGIGITDSDATHLRAPAVMTSTGGGLITGSLGSNQETCFLANGMTVNVRTGNFSGNVTSGVLVGPGNATSAYAIGLPFANGASGGNHSAPLTLGVTSNSTLTAIGNVSATDIDPTWSTIFTVRGIAYDEQDGNVLIGVQTNDVGPTNTKYLVKLDTGDASVLWTLPINNLATYSWGFTFSRIATGNGTFHYVDGNTTRHVQTSDGTETTEAFTGLSVTGPQVSDDVTHSVIAFGSFTPGMTEPDYLGTYMGAGGHHTVASKWLRVWFATVGGEPPESDGGRQGGLSLSDQRAWTYALDDHNFYVLDLGAEGTFVLDKTTGEWAQYETEGADGRWHAINGLNWGTTRIVAGDFETNDVWVVTTDSQVDRDDTVITRVATGEIMLRTRDHVTCSALRVACSVGDLADATATFRLRWSDDRGKTWSAYQAITLTLADDDAEVAYLSLGSFAQPGRIFEISDIGGPVRIDGVDLECPELDRAGN